MQREGRTALGLDEVARRLRFVSSLELFLAVARDEVSPRMLEEALRQGSEEARPGVQSPAGPQAVQWSAADLEARQRIERTGRAQGKGKADVLVVGVDFLMTQLARCCRPIPPDTISGFVTRGRGVSVHRANCPMFAEMAGKSPERVLPTDWGLGDAVYPCEVVLTARDRQGLLRDVSEVFARERINVTAVKTLSRDGVAQMQFTVEVTGVPQLAKTLGAVRGISGVMECRRR
jgi:GTP pyrophosphokinase